MKKGKGKGAFCSARVLHYSIAMYNDEKLKRAHEKQRQRERARTLLRIFQISREEFGILNRTSRDEREEYAEY